MALPPKGDPVRPLHLAIRSTRMLGILLLLPGTCASMPMIFTGMRMGQSTVIEGAFILAIFFGPGMAYLVFSIYLKNRKFWAVLGALILSSILALWSLAAAVYIIRCSSYDPPFRPPILFPAVFVACIITALAQLIYHLSMCFEAIKYVPVEELHGFEPIMLQPLQPPEETGNASGPPSTP